MDTNLACGSMCRKLFPDRNNSNNGLETVRKKRHSPRRRTSRAADASNPATTYPSSNQGRCTKPCATPRHSRSGVSSQAHRLISYSGEFDHLRSVLRTRSTVQQKIDGPIFAQMSKQTAATEPPANHGLLESLFLHMNGAYGDHSTPLRAPISCERARHHDQCVPVAGTAAENDRKLFSAEPHRPRGFNGRKHRDLLLRVAPLRICGAYSRICGAAGDLRVCWRHAFIRNTFGDVRGILAEGGRSVQAACDRGPDVRGLPGLAG